MYTVTPTTSSLKCQGAPFALATPAPFTASPAVAIAGPPSTGAPTGAAAAADVLLLLARAVSTRPQEGHSPLAASSGAFQNLLQSSHHGNCAGLHGPRLGPSRWDEA